MSIPNLSSALLSAQSVQDLSAIFSGQNPDDVNVVLGSTDDEVSVAGYEGTVSTEAIARTVVRIGNCQQTQASKALAATLATKVFEPLTKLVDAPHGGCSVMTYKLFALSRMGWTPPQDPRFGSSVALKHAICLMFLDDSFG
jgi:hypothetical protein